MGILGRISESEESTQIIHRLAIQLLASKARASEAKVDLPTLTQPDTKFPPGSRRHLDTKQQQEAS